MKFLMRGNELESSLFLRRLWLAVTNLGRIVWHRRILFWNLVLSLKMRGLLLIHEFLMWLRWGDKEIRFLSGVTLNALTSSMIMLIGKARVASIQFISLLVKTSQVREYVEILPVISRSVSDVHWIMSSITFCWDETYELKFVMVLISKPYRPLQQPIRNLWLNLLEKFTHVPIIVSCRWLSRKQHFKLIQALSGTTLRLKRGETVVMIAFYLFFSRSTLGRYTGPNGPEILIVICPWDAAWSTWICITSSGFLVMLTSCISYLKCNDQGYSKKHSFSIKTISCLIFSAWA